MSDDLVERLLDWPYQGETMAHEAADRIEALTAQLESTLRDRELILEERDRTFALMLSRAEKAEAESDRLRKALDYILDGMGIAEPDYDIDPDDDFLDAANSEWVRDTLTRLAAALKGETS